MGIHAKDLLNDLKWHRQALDRALVHYVHRGAPGDEMAVPGSDIVALGNSFFTLRREGPGSASIPYHRILRVELDGEVVWERRPPAGPGG